MPIITLTSDWGYRDPYLGAVKGALLKQIPGVVIVDISHDIPKYNIRQAAFVIRNFYRDFPAGTIHIIGVLTEESEDHPHVVIHHNGYYFIGADSGVFSMIFDEEPQEMVMLDVYLDSNYQTFSSRDRFVKAAAHIAHGKPILELGYSHTGLTQKMSLQPVVNGNTIRGNVIYIDSYGNLISNISETLFRQLGNKRKFSLSFRGHKATPFREYRAYGDVPEGEIVVLFGTHGFMEIAINRGKANNMLGLEMDSTIVINFLD
ncbi:MAG: SAM-dependent chlorinase/fluorinase [Bacteroidota bacterium]|nr:SAM-dependent chlorinase/fluorinase [Bacteroidota bacterium]